jgi:hypothetical protein
MLMSFVEAHHVKVSVGLIGSETVMSHLKMRKQANGDFHGYCGVLEAQVCSHGKCCGHTEIC